MADSEVAALETELRRLGLGLENIPGGGLAVDAANVRNLLTRLRALQPPVSWRDVIPNIPAHWAEARPETWTVPYRPLGPYDHQSLPTGPAVHISWPRATERTCLDHLVAAARTAGWRVHGAGFIEVTNPEWSTLDAMLILEAGTDQTILDEFLEWLGDRTDVELAAVPRRGDEGYAQDL